MRQADSLVVWIPPGRPWEEHYSTLLKNHGFKRLKSVRSSTKTRDMSGVVHGDDFVWEGIVEDLDWDCWRTSTS